MNTESKFMLLQHAFEELSCIAVEFRTHFFNRTASVWNDGPWWLPFVQILSLSDAVQNIRDVLAKPEFGTGLQRVYEAEETSKNLIGEYKTLSAA